MKLLLAAVAALTFTFAVSGQTKKPLPPVVKPSFADSLQIVVVTTPSDDSVTGTGHLFERRAKTGAWISTGEPFAVVVGRNGLARDESTPWTDTGSIAFKRESDGRSPAGIMPLTSSFGTSAKSEALTMPYTRIGEFTECVDDVRSTFYNKIVDRMQVGNFDWKSSEKMAKIVPEYDLGIFVGYNSYPVERGNGSCIFLHIWKDAASGTAGCTAMDRRDLEKLAVWLRPGSFPFLVQLTTKDYSKYRKTWNLPKI